MRYKTKNPTGVRREDFPDHASYAKAYRAAYVKLPSTDDRFKPKYSAEAPPPCPKCSTPRVKTQSGQWSCAACKLKQEQHLANHWSRIAESRKNKAERRLRIAQKAAERAVKRKEIEAARAAHTAEMAKLKARPPALTAGFFLSPAESERFYSQAEPSGDCLIWRGSEFFYVNAIEARPHRLLWFLTHGEIPEGMVLGKLCETRNCISPNCRKLETPTELQLRLSAPAKAFRDTYRGVSGQTSAKPIPPFSQEMKDRFWSKVDKSSSCWIWTGQKTEDGYGRQMIRSVPFPAHRVAYFLHYGSIDNSLQVLHSCDSPFCLNPLHLSQGNNTENHLDSVARNRISSEDFLKRKIIPSESQATEIKSLISSGIKPNVVSRKFGVSEDVISTIMDGSFRPGELPLI